MSPVTRRSVLTAGGWLLAGTLVGCTPKPRRRPVLRRAQGGPLPGEIDHVPSICLQCPAGCGILVERIDGMPRAIRGNPDYPTNAGGLCPKGVAGLQTLYDPDRIKGPLRRVGKRGEERWEEIAWDDAIREVAQRLRGARDSAGPQSTVFLGGRYQGSMLPLVEHFLAAYGSPNHLGNGSVGSDGTKFALEMTQGIHDYPGFDWENTNYVLAFGASWLEAYRPTAYLLRAYGHLRRGRPGMRAKLVHIDPRFSVTSAKADEWVPVRTGTDAALALGIAHVLVREGLHDEQFVAERTFGFEDWEDDQGPHRGLRSVLEDYEPARVEQITGVEAARVERLAREFGSGRPAFAVGERGTSMQSNGLYTRMAVHCLNALVGSINRPGGMLVQQPPPLRPMPESILDEVAREGLRMPRIDGAGSRRYPLAHEVSQALPDALRGPSPASVELLFLYYSNPLFSRTNREQWRDALLDPDRVRFTVSFSPFWDESTLLADLVLPDHTYLERWQDVPVLPSVGFPLVGLRQPTTEPLHDTRSTGDVLLDIAHAADATGAPLLPTVSESLPWKRFRDLVTWRLEGIADARPGKSGRTLVAEIEQRGGWWDDTERFVPWNQAFRTQSGRFEFFSLTLRDRLCTHLRKGESLDALLQELGVEARGDLAFLPHYERLREHGDPDVYPLLLNTYKLMARAEGRGANQPYLQELGGLHVRESWQTWLEINPATARRLGIDDGDEVEVRGPPRGELPGGVIRVRARHFEGARPDVVNMPFDQGHRGYGRWASRVGVNPNDVLVRDEDRLTGQASFFGTRVQVRRV